MEKISIKLDSHKLKKINDFLFIFIENILIKFDKIVHIYLDFYKPMVENEIIFAHITNKDNILHIGCGPVPSTSIYIAKRTDANITAIDKNLLSTKKAQTLILKLKLFSKIHIIHANALNFSIEKFNLIIISLGIKSYEDILKYISQNMRNDTRVIVRTNSLIDGSLAEKDIFLKEIFTIDKIIPQKKNGLMISVLLSKK